MLRTRGRYPPGGRPTSPLHEKPDLGILLARSSFVGLERDIAKPIVCWQHSRQIDDEILPSKRVCCRPQTLVKDWRVERQRTETERRHC